MRYPGVAGEHMKVLVVGCGRVGSAVACQLDDAGWEVSVIDEREDARSRLPEDWAGEFHVGHGMDSLLLRRAGIEDADAVIATTDGDNTNIVVGQVAQKQFDIRTVVVRILDPARAEFFAGRGLDVVCPTKNAIEALTAAVESQRSTVG
jgi:trk system potassium uptake protein TrkA